MRMPDRAWGLLIEIDNDVERDKVQQISSLVGSWSPSRPPTHGELVLQLAASSSNGILANADSCVDVTLLLAFRGRWERVGVWKDLKHDWPQWVAPTAHATARLQGCWTTDNAESLHNPFQGWPNGLFYLLADGMLHVGDELVWERPIKRVRHVARVRADGWLVLSDGTAHASPRRAVVALGEPNVSGWDCWRRAGDNRSLAALRDDYRSCHYGHPRPRHTSWASGLVTGTCDRSP